MPLLFFPWKPLLGFAVGSQQEQQTAKSAELAAQQAAVDPAGHCEGQHRPLYAAELVLQPMNPPIWQSLCGQ
jgi:hypothetical protein